MCPALAFDAAGHRVKGILGILAQHGLAGRNRILVWFEALYWSMLPTQVSTVCTRVVAPCADCWAAVALLPALHGVLIGSVRLVGGELECPV